jgi:hypothetical protein
MAGGSVTLFGGLLVGLCITLFALAVTSSGTAERVVIAPDLEPLKRSIMVLQQDNSMLRRRLNRTEHLTAENIVLKESVHVLEDKLRRLLQRQGAVVLPTKASGVVPRSTAPPPPDALDTKFTRERAHRVATNGKILLTFVNRIRLDFATTWVHHVKRLGMTNWLVGATDKASLTSLTQSGVPTFDMLTELPEGEWAWGSASFKSLGVWRGIGTRIQIG